MSVVVSVCMSIGLPYTALYPVHAGIILSYILCHYTMYRSCFSSLLLTEGGDLLLQNLLIPLYPAASLVDGKVKQKNTSDCICLGSHGICSTCR